MMMITQKWARRVTALAFAYAPIAAYAGPQPPAFEALRPLVVRDSQGALVGRLIESGLGPYCPYCGGEQPTTVVVRVIQGKLVPLVVRPPGTISGTTYPELVHAEPQCTSPGVMWWGTVSLFPPTFVDGTELTYGVETTTLPQIASFTLYHVPADECLGSWQQGTAFVLPDGRCCFTWATPYGQGEKLPFAVPATVDMSGWNLVPPFHVE